MGVEESETPDQVIGEFDANLARRGAGAFSAIVPPGGLSFCEKGSRPRLQRSPLRRFLRVLQQPVEDAVDELRRLLRAEAAGQVDRLVDRHSRRRVGVQDLERA